MSEKPLSEQNDLPDDELARRAREGDTDALVLLIARYSVLAGGRAKSYRVAGLEEEDLTQECLIGLLKAVRNYDGAASFRPYAVLCMKRQLFTAVKAGLAKKHGPLNNYVSLEGEGSPFPGAFEPSVDGPETLLILEEGMEQRRRQMEALLSSFERDALKLYLCGFTYEEMSKRLKSTEKSVDNALQRVRRKLRSAGKALDRHYL
ncbi:MAG: sigma-70 family RNA polymerase sigma factor [Oscillospiraceae bacterium]|nr:sigma-70 family RNA polymerase sigma factor [Oscillospiraceae bacterium]